MRKYAARFLALAMISALVVVAGAGTGTYSSAASGTIQILPLISDWVFLSADGTPPSQAACVAVNRRCFNPAAMANSYNYAGLHALGNRGQGKTIAVVDSFGATTVRSDLGVFNTAFNLPHLCGETGPSDPSANCPSSVSPRFDIVCVQGCPTPNPPPSNSGTVSNSGSSTGSARMSPNLAGASTRPSAPPMGKCASRPLRSNTGALDGSATPTVAITAIP